MQPTGTDLRRHPIGTCEIEMDYILQSKWEAGRGPGEWPSWSTFTPRLIYHKEQRDYVFERSGGKRHLSIAFLMIARLNVTRMEVRLIYGYRFINMVMKCKFTQATYKNRKYLCIVEINAGMGKKKLMGMFLTKRKYFQSQQTPRSHGRVASATMPHRDVE